MRSERNPRGLEQSRVTALSSSFLCRVFETHGPLGSESTRAPRGTFHTTRGWARRPPTTSPTTAPAIDSLPMGGGACAAPARRKAGVRWGRAANCESFARAPRERRGGRRERRGDVPRRGIRRSRARRAFEAHIFAARPPRPRARRARVHPRSTHDRNPKNTHAALVFRAGPAAPLFSRLPARRACTSKGLLEACFWAS